jgi:transcription antitermination factor NusG
MPYPIMVLEGFGKIPINPVAYRLLSTSAQRETTLNAARFDRTTGEKPELIIPVVGEVASSVPVELEPLDVGKRVRIMHPPYRGMVGTVSNLAGNQQMPNGLRAESVEITFGEEEKVVVPVANIEILG